MDDGRRWATLSRSAEKKDVILGLHPQYVAESSLMLTVDDALEIIGELKSKMVKIIYDTAQQNISYRNFADDLRKAGANLCHVHAADNDGISWTHEAVGQGTVDWDGIVRALEEIGFDGYICTQSWSELPNDVDTVMRDSKIFLEALLLKVAGERGERTRRADVDRPIVRSFVRQPSIRPHRVSSWRVGHGPGAGSTALFAALHDDVMGVDERVGAVLHRSAGADQSEKPLRTHPSIILEAVVRGGESALGQSYKQRNTLVLDDLTVIEGSCPA